MADPQKDLDAFLTSTESKLRAPFSSLDLTKAISTPTLRGSLSEQEYLDRIAQVISRADKITQTQIIIALLGLDPSDDIDESIENILSIAQDAPPDAEWVRIVACLARGIMFDGEDGKPCRGQEADKLLETTCKQIINRVKRLDYETGGLTEEPTRLATADADPLFAPYRYALLKQPLLEKIMPETHTNPHFQVNESAEILSMDPKLESQKATEEKEHSLMAGRPKTVTGNTKSAAMKEAPAPFLPGLRAANTEKSAVAKERPKSSLFMPTRKPVAAAKGIKPALHTRKAGAAQALLAKGKRRLQANAAAISNSTTAAGGVRGRAANKLGNNRSKMKMLDVSEVLEINKDIKEREEVEDKKISGRKRKADPGGLAKAVKLKKSQKVEESKPSESPEKEKDEELEEAEEEPPQPAPAAPQPATGPTGALDLASMALSAYQAQVGAASTVEQPQHKHTQNSLNPAVTSPAPLPRLPHAHAPKQQDWRVLLQEKSNRLSAEDRSRVQQFFEDKFNPTPHQPVYKMKLHEERSTDPKTGVPVKETFYLELDYTTFTSKQSKKTKRYT